MIHNFDFVKGFAPDVADILNLADCYLYLARDPHGSILKAGSAIQLLTQHIIEKECLSPQPWISECHHKCITFLQDKLALPKKVVEAMHHIRKKRNDAYYNNKASEYDIKVCMKKAHKILCWCIEHYNLGITTEYVAPDNDYKPFCDISKIAFFNC